MWGVGISTCVLFRSKIRGVLTGPERDHALHGYRPEMNLLQTIRTRGTSVAEAGVTYDASSEDPLALTLLHRLTGDETTTRRRFVSDS